jgi:serine/threonine protein kinase
LLPQFPQKLGAYVLLKRLGLGGMSEVYLAMSGHRELETLCVVKRLLPALLSRPEEVARFRHEADLARRLVHSNIAHTHNIGEVDGEVFLVQEFVEGHDVSTVLEETKRKNRKLPVGVAAYIASELARGLAYAHAFENLDLVHRDINLPNVRLTYAGEVKLLDFGIASSNLHGGNDGAAGAAGKLWHLAPEQVRPGQTIDRRVDLYALGVVLWELLTQRPVGTTLEDGVEKRIPETEGEILAWITHASHLPPSRFNKEVPPSLDALVCKATSLEPSDRFQSADELRNALGPFLSLSIHPERWLSDLLRELFSPDRERKARRQLIESARDLLDVGVTSEREPSETALRAPSRPSSTREKLLWIAPIVAGALLGLATLLWLRAKRDADARSNHEAPTAAVAAPVGGGAQALPMAAAEPAAAVVLPPSQPAEADASTGSDLPAKQARPALAKRPDTGADSTAAAPKPNHLTLAREAFNSRDWPKALAEGRAAIAEGGGAEAHAVVGNTCFKMGRFAEAEKEYAKAAALDPKSPLLQERLRIAHAKAEEFKSSKEP